MASPATTESSPRHATVISHKPYVPDEAKMPEFTWRAVILGTLLGIVFGASSLYLVLKVGMTVSASIPVAVLSMTMFRALSKLPFVRRATILENNIVQTTGSAGESIAFGVGVTMPALMLLGFEMDVGRVLVVSVLGGLLGILMMIPLRRAFIVKKHGELKYPEGTACADVLIVGEEGGSNATTVFVGFGVAFVFQFIRVGLRFFKEVVSTPLTWFKGAEPALETDPTLLGVGYIIGTRISCIMVAGGVLAAFVLIPAIRFFGDAAKTAIPPGSKPIAEMSRAQIQHDYVLYIGAGAVAAGGIISLIQALPLILGSLRSAFGDLGRSRNRNANGGAARTDRDLPLTLVGVGSIVLVLFIWLTTPLHQLFPWVPQLHMNLVGAILIVIFGFLFVTVSSRLTGEIGSSSNPISGMTVATLLLTCLIFLSFGWTAPEDQVTALSVAAVVCIASSNGGTTSQDLKTGYLIGATPKWQQLAILIGALSSAVVIGFVLIKLNDAYTVYSKKAIQDLPPLKESIDVSALTETVIPPNDGRTYHVLRVREGNPYGLPAAGQHYLVDDKGAIVYVVDPGINGSLKRREDGTQVQKFDAPKAVLMAFITNGVLDRKLPWNLVLLGVFITVMLELCGIPSLAFAVGVYLPLSTSAPIFVGGMVRYVADRWGRRGSDAPMSETEADMSPGVLVSTGYIAGGAIAGVLIAFLNFSDTIPKLLARWEYTKTEIPNPRPFSAAMRQVAMAELGLQEPVPEEKKKELDDMIQELSDLNSELKIKYLPVGGGTEIELPNGDTYHAKERIYLTHVAKLKLGDPENVDGLFELNLNKLIQVPSRTVLTLPADRPIAEYGPIYWARLVSAGNLPTLLADLPPPTVFPVSRMMNVGDAAQGALGNSDKGRLLYNVNKSKLEPDVELQSRTKIIKVPQQNWPALAAFGALVLLLLIVGLGFWLRAPTATAPPHQPPES